ncbi:MAG: hypothetical protein AAF384_14695 [Pseudomonadota bacterium]
MRQATDHKVFISGFTFVMMSVKMLFTSSGLTPAMGANQSAPCADVDPTGVLLGFKKKFRDKKPKVHPNVSPKSVSRLQKTVNSRAN